MLLCPILLFSCSLFHHISHTRCCDRFLFFSLTSFLTAFEHFRSDSWLLLEKQQQSRPYARYEYILLWSIAILFSCRISASHRSFKCQHFEAYFRGCISVLSALASYLPSILLERKSQLGIRVHYKFRWPLSMTS